MMCNLNFSFNTEGESTIKKLSNFKRNHLDQDEMLRVNPYHVLQHLFGVHGGNTEKKIHTVYFNKNTCTCMQLSCGKVNSFSWCSCQTSEWRKKNMISVTICGTDAECWFEYFGNGCKFHTNQTVVCENPSGFTKCSN